MKGILESYAERVKKSKHIPILLINEADAVLSVRTSVGGNNPTNEDILNEVNLFSENINTYLKGGLPLDEWVPRLQAGCHKEKDFVKYNYEGMLDIEGQVRVIQC